MRKANNKVHPEITIQLFRLASKLFFLFPQKKRLTNQNICFIIPARPGFPSGILAAFS